VQSTGIRVAKAAVIPTVWSSKIMSINTLWTIGHSNRDLAGLLALLASERIEMVADVRRFPGSRRYPQFGRDALASALRDAGVVYVHFSSLGGRRTQQTTSSQNAGWRVAAFAAFADYMQTAEFSRAFEELSELAARSRTAIMCAEALPWRCHRRLIADQFVARGWTVLDIIGPAHVKDHELPSFARVEHGLLTYPG
jgi:uncharacterized protein (DUF488 family)